MKIAVPLTHGCVGDHFGHSATFALLDVDPASKAIITRQTMAAPMHEPGVLPRWLQQCGADVVITGGMGPRAQAAFAEHGIRVVMGAPAVPLDEVVEAFLTGEFKTGANACHHNHT